MSSERTKGADDKNVCQNKVSKNTRTSSAQECRGDQAYVSLHILNKLKGYKASKLPVALHVCVYVCERWCVCVCVEIKARPVLTPCASLGKIKPSWGQGQWRGGNKCEQKRGKKGERECSEALKSRGGPADIFYVHVEEKKKGFVVVFCSFTVMKFVRFNSAVLLLSIIT